MKHLVVAACAAACGGPAAPPLSNAPAANGPVRSCALAEPRRTPVSVRYTTWLGRIGDRSWLLGEDHKQRVLVALGDDGALAITPLPGSTHDNFATAIVGTHLWFDTESRVARREMIYDIDLSTGRPAIGGGAQLSGKTLAGSTSFGIGSTRALFYSSFNPPGLQLWDREHHVLVTAAALSSIHEPEIRCVRDHCFAMIEPGTGIASQRFDAAGASTNEMLTTDDPITHYALIPDGDRTLAVWSSGARPGVFARTLDATGHAVGAEFALRSLVTEDLQLVAGPRPALAFRDETGWALAWLGTGGDVLEPAQRIGGSNEDRLVSAQAPDGAFAIAFSTRPQSDVMPDPSRKPATAAAIFVPAAGPPAPPIDLELDEGQGGWTPFPLVAPGYAAALLVEPTSVPDGDGRLVMLRVPCPPGS